MQIAIHVGAIVDKAAIDPLTDAILRIMEARGDQKTVRAGLSTLRALAAPIGPPNLSMSNCSIVGEEHHHTAGPSPIEDAADPTLEADQD